MATMMKTTQTARVTKGQWLEALLEARASGRFMGVREGDRFHPGKIRSPAKSVGGRAHPPTA
jgi:hypothetical protein